MKTKELLIALIALAIGIALGWLLATQQAVPEKLENTNDDNKVSQHVLSDYLAAQLIDEGGEMPGMQGMVDATGTHFEDVNSGIAIDVSSVVTLYLETTESGEFRMAVHPNEGTKVFNVSGLTPNSTSYLYINDYHEYLEITTDATGSTSFSLDTTRGPSVWTQKEKSTYFISKGATGGDCADPTDPIGTWDSASHTCTLNTDITHQAVQIDDDDIVLDCAGHLVEGTYPGGFAAGILIGIYPVGDHDHGYSNVTVKNCKVSTFGVGIGASWRKTGDGHKFLNNVITNTTRGLQIVPQHNWWAEGHPAERVSSDNVLAGNNISAPHISWLTSVGIDATNLITSTMADNTVSGYEEGIRMDYSANGFNTIENNTISHSDNYNIVLWGGSDNTVIGNKLSNAGRYNLVIGNWPSRNSLTGNILSNAGWDNISIINGWYQNDVTGNTMSGASNAGIRTERSSYTIIADNDIEPGNEAGIAIRRGAGNRAEGNTIAQGAGNGIFASYTDGAVITRNLIFQNGGYGLELVGSPSTEVFLNDIWLNADLAVFSDTPVELSTTVDGIGVGNWWHGNCGKGLFVVGEDSNVLPNPDDKVIDSHPYNGAVAHVPDPNTPSSCPGN